MRSTSDKSATATASTPTTLAAARLQVASTTSSSSSVILFFRAACSRCFWLLSQVKWHWYTVTQYYDWLKTPLEHGKIKVAATLQYRLLLSVTDALKIWIFFDMITDAKCSEFWVLFLNVSTTYKCWYTALNSLLLASNLKCPDNRHQLLIWQDANKRSFF